MHHRKSPGVSRESSSSSGSSEMGRPSRKKCLIQLDSESETIVSSDPSVQEDFKLHRMSNSSFSDSSFIDRQSREKCHVVCVESETSSDVEFIEVVCSRVLSSSESSSNHSFGSESEVVSSRPSTVPSSQQKMSEMSKECLSDKEGQVCIICLKTLEPPMGRPSNCEHDFHFECLATWSKTSNTCPIDRTKYTEILMTGSSGQVISRRKVDTPPPQGGFDDYESLEFMLCEICCEYDILDMLQCDNCHAGYHIDCLPPRLAQAVSGHWLCPSCTHFINIRP